MSWKIDNAQAKRRWIGPREKYDLITEGSIALVVVAVLLLVIALLFGAPKVPAVSFQGWAQADPTDFVSTALTELAGTSETATYGPPYNNGTGQVQSLGPLSPQTWVGVHMPVNPPQEFVIGPLTAVAPLNQDLQKALEQWNGATAEQQQTWTTNAISSTVNIKETPLPLRWHGKRPAASSALTVEASKVTFKGGRDTGPVATLMSGMLMLAQSGALDSQSINAPGNTYSMNYTKSLLFQSDGNYLTNIANYYNMKGEQWGVMNEIGSWPGQPWLWAYDMWYNTPPWSNNGSDILAIAMFGLVIAIVFFLPFIPGLRSIPRAIRLYRLIWRPYYEKYGAAPAAKESKK
jgi:hypothetical protein